jgi:hypothetical protein
MRPTLVVVAAAGLAAFVAAAADKPTYSHQDYFEHYDGTATCLACHEDEAVSFFHSQHYQWSGETPAIVNADGKKLGKINTINDFCTNPGPAWIGITKNSRGEVLSQGCSKCHAGLGKLPSPELSREQLENIDCLICHASGYNRSLYANEDGSLEWKPILWQNQAGLDSVAKRITMPKRASCLRCHAGSGGGPNFKRGDIEYELAETDRAFDVHMGTDGADMACTDCHAGSSHRIRGRGVDLMGSDVADGRLSCADGACHAADPHSKELLNRHAARVDCTVCHIPTFARADATDMVRDWSKPAYSEEKDKHTPTFTMGTDVAPEIAWYNGSVRAQLPGVPVAAGADGIVGMVEPQGSRADAGSKLFAFKVHRATMPVLAEKRWLLPINVEEFFADGDIDGAVREAAHVMYGLEEVDYDWVEVKRYMGIFHGVQPARAAALRCLDCHGPDGRLDWTGLGYPADPLAEALEPPS